MPRKLKPYKITQMYSGKLLTSVDIFIDRNTDPPEFFAMVGIERVSGVSAEECKKNLQTKIDEQIEYEWKQIIVVGSDEPTSYYGADASGVQLSLEKYEIAHMRGDTYMERAFRTPADDCDYDEEYENKDWVIGRREAQTDLQYYSGTKPKNPGGNNRVLDYTPQLWNDLRKIQEAIRELGKRLQTIVGTPTLIRQLVESIPNTRLLGDGIAALPEEKE